AYFQLFDNPTQDSLISQGYTTVLVGNCGASLAPLLSKHSLLAIQKWHTLEGINVNWQSFDEYLRVLAKQPLACNVASLVGYATLRRGIIGDEIRPLQKEEMVALQKILAESLEAGAFGLSSGLSYAHEIIISELELFELAKAIKKSDALFSVHLRSESSEVVEALEEILDVARSTELNLKISHLKIKGQSNWHKFDDVVSRIDSAYHKGMRVHFDVYPYDRIWQVLYSYLPKWAIEGGRAAMLSHFADPVQKNKILAYLNSSDVKFPSLLVASTSNKLNFTGKTIGQIAKNLESSSEQAVLHLIENGGSEVMVFEQALDQTQAEELALHPLSFIGTDGAGFGFSEHHRLVHPRCFGAAPKFLRLALNKKQNLAEAIKKLSSGPAKKIGLKKRGEIKIGNFADLVLFDESTVNDSATYENPYQFSKGIERVFVNGQEVFSSGKPTGKLPGYALRKN
ncbi:MAG: amidohydrolase family protein, partial [Patescibacteria group bacterium]|nr:amidohydrolase family protein [Patescibacteria group bacterium]